jgi:hypothetical protein
VKQGQVVGVVLDQQSGGDQVVSRRQHGPGFGAGQQREILQVHIGIAGQKAEQHLLAEIANVQSRRGRESPDSLANLLVGAPVFVLGEPAGKLAKILHGQLSAVFQPVNATGEVSQVAILEPNQRVGHRSQARQLGQVHGGVFHLRQLRKVAGRGLEDVLAPQAHYGEARRVGGLLARLDRHRYFRLHARHCYLAAHRPQGEFQHVGFGVGQCRRRGPAKDAAAAGRMKIRLAPG